MILRAAIVVSAGLALLVSTAASSPSAPGGLGFVAIAALVSAGVSTAVPDHHVGLVTSLLIGVHWWLGVDDVATPWAIVTAAALVAHHTALAAASLAPMGSVWTRPMRVRWLRRLAIVSMVAVPTWGVVWLLDRVEVPSSSPLVGSALLVLAVAGWWIRGREPSARRA